MTKVPRPSVQKITELSILVPSAVRIIEDARIIELTGTHVVLRYKKPRSVKRWEQLFPLSQVLYIRDKGTEAASEPEAEAEEGQEKAASKPKRICDAVVIDTFQLDEFADIASIDKLDGDKVFATTTEGDKIVADRSICRFVQDVAANSAGASIAAGLSTAGPATAAAPTGENGTRASRPPRASANFS